MVERLLAKEKVAGSTPVFRSLQDFALNKNPALCRLVFCFAGEISILEAQPVYGYFPRVQYFVHDHLKIFALMFCDKTVLDIPF